MICSARKQYYLGCLGFLELKSVNIKKKKRICTSIIVLILFLHATFMQIGENGSAHEIRFFYYFLF